MVVREKSVVVIPRFFLLVFSLMILNSYFVASDVGGVITNVGGYTIHTFNVTGNFTFNVTANKNIELLIVGGGGAGGHSATGNAGGGGAGGLVYNVSYPVVVGSYNVSVGSGGIYIANSRGGNGTNSSFGTIIAVGGGGGGTLGTSGNPGGSGGGSGQQGLIGGTGIAGQGFNGGNNLSNGFGGAGGGGANQSGRNTSINNFGEGGFGGNGTNYSISGVSICYAGGGGGSTHSSNTTSTGSLGGCGGGGKGSAVTQGVLGANGTNGLGGGGGGNGENGGASGYGGSGIVIVRYLTPVVLQVNISPSNGSSFFVGNHNYFDANVSSSGFGGNVSTTAFVYNSTDDLIYTYFGQSNPFLFNVTNLSIGTYKINSSVNNYTNFDVYNQLFINRTGLFDGIRKGGQTNSDFNGKNQSINITGTNMAFVTWNGTFSIQECFAPGEVDVLPGTEYMFLTVLTKSGSDRVTSTINPVNTTHYRYTFNTYNGTIYNSIQQSLSSKEGEVVCMGVVYNYPNKQLYLNGFPIANSSSSTYAWASSLPNIGLGVFNTTNGATAFNGTFFSIKIWNKTLSDSEFSSEYNLGFNALTTNVDGLVLQYLLNNTASVYSNSTNVFNVQRDLFGMYKPIQTGIFNGLRANGQTGNSFNGSQNISIANMTLNLSSQYYTYGAWFIRNNTATMGILQLQNTSIDRRLRLFTASTSTIEHDLNPGEQGNAVCATCAPINTLIYAVGSSNGTNTFLYINGTLINITEPFLLNVTFNRLQIGDLGGNNYLRGYIYKVNLWNRSLSASEVASEYALGANSPTNITDGLVLQYLLANSNSIYANDSTVFNTNIALDKQGGFENSSVTNNINIYNLTNQVLTTPSSLATRKINITWNNITINPTNTPINLMNYNISLYNENDTLIRYINITAYNNRFEYNWYNENKTAGNYRLNLTITDSNQITTNYQKNISFNTDMILNLSLFTEVNNTPINGNNLITLTNLENGNITTINGSSSTIIDLKKANNYYIVIIPTQGYAITNATYLTNNTLTSQSLNITLFTSNSINITILNQDTGNRIYDNISVTFTGVGVQTYYTNTSQLYVDNLANGAWNLRFTGNGYGITDYTITVNNQSHQTLNAYLVSGNYTTIFTVLNNDNTPLENANIGVERQFNASYVNIQTLTTDITGKATLYYTPSAPYRFTVTKNGYQSRTFNLSSILYTDYTIYLSNQLTGNYGNPFTDVIVSINPSVVNNNALANISVNINSPVGSLLNYSYQIIYTPVGVVGYYNASNSYGDTSLRVVNISSATYSDQLYIDLTYTSTLSGTINNRYPLTILNVATGSYTIAKLKSNDYGLGWFEKIGISTLILVVVVGYSFVLAGIGGSLVIGMLTEGVLVYLGMMPLYGALISMFVGFILLIRFGGN